MALTVTEQLEILKGNATPPSNSLRDLLSQIAIVKGKSFKDTYKNFDANTFPKAGIYVDKMLNVISQAYSLSNNVNNSFLHLIVAIIGESTVTFAQLQGATDEQWENFIMDNMINVFEEYIRISRDEEAEYNSLP